MDMPPSSQPPLTKQKIDSQLVVERVLQLVGTIDSIPDTPHDIFQFMHNIESSFKLVDHPAIHLMIRLLIGNHSPRAIHPCGTSLVILENITSDEIEGMPSEKIHRDIALLEWIEYQDVSSIGKNVIGCLASIVRIELLTRTNQIFTMPLVPLGLDICSIVTYWQANQLAIGPLKTSLYTNAAGHGHTKALDSIKEALHFAPAPPSSLADAMTTSYIDTLRNRSYLRGNVDTMLSVASRCITTCDRRLIHDAVTDILWCAECISDAFLVTLAILCFDGKLPGYDFMYGDHWVTQYFQRDPIVDDVQGIYIPTWSLHEDMRLTTQFKCATLRAIQLTNPNIDDIDFDGTDDLQLSDGLLIKCLMISSTSQITIPSIQWATETDTIQSFQ